VPSIQKIKRQAVTRFPSTRKLSATVLGRYQPFAIGKQEQQNGGTRLENCAAPKLRGRGE
jgi:hypothetical protein